LFEFPGVCSSRQACNLLPTSASALTKITPFLFEYESDLDRLAVPAGQQNGTCAQRISPAVRLAGALEMVIDTHEHKGEFKET
jgi:hypothetical protein